MQGRFNLSIFFSFIPIQSKPYCFAHSIRLYALTPSSVVSEEIRKFSSDSSPP